MIKFKYKIINKSTERWGTEPTAAGRNYCLFYSELLEFQLTNK